MGIFGAAVDKLLYRQALVKPLVLVMFFVSLLSQHTHSVSVDHLSSEH